MTLMARLESQLQKYETCNTGEMEQGIKETEGFLGGQVVKTPYFQCIGPVFDPWLGNKIPHAAWCGQKKKKIQKERREERNNHSGSWAE